ncbi:unnamed protein product, partial [Pylaiella littoralis]
ERQGQREGETPPSSLVAGDSTAAAAAATGPAEGVLLIKRLQPLAVVKICLRRLGLAHTGAEGETEVQVQGSAQLQKLVRQVVDHKRVATVLKELQERVTMRRRDKLAESEGRPLQGQGRSGRAARRKGKGKRASAETDGRQQEGGGGGGGGGGGKKKTDSARRQHAAAGSAGSAFVSLSGEPPSNDEKGSASRCVQQKNYYNKSVANAMSNAQPERRRPNGGSRSAPAAPAAKAPKSKNSSSSDREKSEPGWAGADRVAGWGRGGGRSKNGGRG